MLGRRGNNWTFSKSFHSTQIQLFVSKSFEQPNECKVWREFWNEYQAISYANSFTRNLSSVMCCTWHVGLAKSDSRNCWCRSRSNGNASIQGDNEARDMSRCPRNHNLCLKWGFHLNPLKLLIRLSESSPRISSSFWKAFLSLTRFIEAN